MESQQAVSFMWILQQRTQRWYSHCWLLTGMATPSVHGGLNMVTAASS